MRRQKFLSFGLILLCFAFLSLWAYENLSPFERNQEWMELNTAKKKWGNISFSAEKFRRASVEERAGMAAALIESRLYIGKTPGQVREDLGSYTGYFFSDRIPAYKIYEGWKKNENTWNIVFLPGLNGKIKDIRIHKNCCSDEIWKEKGIVPPNN